MCEKFTEKETTEERWSKNLTWHIISRELKRSPFSFFDIHVYPKYDTKN